MFSIELHNLHINFEESILLHPLPPPPHSSGVPGSFRQLMFRTRDSRISFIQRNAICSSYSDDNSFHHGAVFNIKTCTFLCNFFVLIRGVQLLQRVAIFYICFYLVFSFLKRKRKKITDFLLLNIWDCVGSENVCNF